MMPLYEAKMLHLYDTRWATYESDGTSRSLSEDEKAERLPPLPRYWVTQAVFQAKVDGRVSQGGILGWRDVCRSTDVRTMVTTLGPRLPYGHKWMLAVVERGRAELQWIWSSFAFDYVARQKLGGTSMSYGTVMQLPMPLMDQIQRMGVPFDRSLDSWLGVRVDRLNGWIAEATDRAWVRAELDAAAFHVYSLSRSDVDHIMETFPIVKRKDMVEFGSYRSKELILLAYDAMAEAIATGTPYRASWEEA